MPVGISTEYDANSIKRKRPETQADIRAHLLPCEEGAGAVTEPA